MFSVGSFPDSQVLTLKALHSNRHTLAQVAQHPPISFSFQFRIHFQDFRFVISTLPMPLYK